MYFPHFDWISILLHLGKLIGTFYDENGKPTEAMKEAKKLIKEGKRQEKEKANDQRLYPGCNSEWAQDKGGRVWCSTMRLVK